ncbi:alpha-galactosidase [Kribbella sindirgiensis]|uniref:alpha-galactosidase n=1 Tax=Kribbella sindirgiensis TaxID=1124744 RepID=A0A4R0IZ19_9ACTN|nr:alpha-galactosidase [Kribbella sindirgiensis]TCC39333.1 alpha-galactosidase [Kribbella sindirgiensis]
MTWTLRGTTTSYVVGVPGHGVLAQLVAWGPHAVAEGPSTIAPAGTEHFLPRADVEPVEYAVRGSRYTAPVDLVASGPDGVDELDFGFWAADASEDQLELTFVDNERGVLLDLHYRIVGDVVERWVSVRKDGTGELTLHRHDSAGFVIPTGTTVKYLWGEWNSEFQQAEVTLPRGRFTIGSAQGITGHSYAPFMAVDGEVAYGVQLAWSGSWEMTADVDTTGLLRIQAGRTSSSLGITVRPGETWVSPKAVGACSAEGADGLARVFHEYERTQSRRRTPKVLYNSWFATEFDIRAEHQLELARRAASIGVETFVVDDGWFVGRSDDTGGLGDWEVDPAKFPDGLDRFIGQLKDLGLDFGLWIEPESVSPSSQLAAEHPEWILRTPDRERGPILIRNQLLLDLSRDDVADFIWSTLDRLLSTYDIKYLKWDANRPRLDSGDQRRDLDGLVVANLYSILDRLRDQHPDVYVEGCAGGGARVDLGMASRVDTLWPSDNTAPLDRLRIQEGFRSGFAPHLMSSWVTDAEGTHDGRRRSLDFRFHVAMAGVLGIGADLSRWTDDQLKTAARHIEQYKGFRELIAESKVYGLAGGVQYVGPRKSVVFLWETGDGNVRGTLPTRPRRVPLAGLDPAKNYRVGNETHPGSYLLQVGVAFDDSADSRCLIVEALD